LFKALTGLLSAQGIIEINGTLQPHAHHHVSYMMQEDLLLPWRTVIENLLLIGELGNSPQNTKELKQEALFFLEEVGLSNYVNYYPQKLSGGMRQRVSLARALLQRKPLILLDEPFGALDALLREQMHGLLQSMQKCHKVTIMLITHDFRDALTLSDRIFLLLNGNISDEWPVSETIRHDPQLQHTLAKEIKERLKYKTRIQ
jgi:ABC-type nitrate/sulfonate/bicarbonate transport system ATPase subunit